MPAHSTPPDGGRILSRKRAELMTSDHVLGLPSPPTLSMSSSVLGAAVENAVPNAAGVCREHHRPRDMLRPGDHLALARSVPARLCRAHGLVCRGRFARANHNSVAAMNTDLTKRVMELGVKAGETVKLSSAGSSDPDGNSFTATRFVNRRSKKLHGRSQANIRHGPCHVLHRTGGEEAGDHPCYP